MLNQDEFYTHVMGWEWGGWGGDGMEVVGLVARDKKLHLLLHW